LNYFDAGSSLLMGDHWTQQYELTFALELNRAECEFLTGRHESAEERLAALTSRAANQVDRAAVTCQKLELYTMQDRPQRAVEVCLEYLRQEESVEWSSHPTDQYVREEYDRLWRLIGSRSIEDLVDLPVMKELSALATMDVLTRLWSAAFFTDENLAVLVATHMAIRSIQQGNTDASCCGYAWLAIMVGSFFGDYESTRRFGQLSLDLVEQRALSVFAARVYNVVAAGVVPWTQHISAGPQYLQRSLDLAAKAGDVAYSAYSHMHLNSHLLACGEPLDKIEVAVSDGLNFVRKARFGLIVAQHTTHLQLTRTLRGLTREFGLFNDESFDEGAFEQRLAKNPNLNYAACWYWIRKMQARVWANDPKAALAAASEARELLWTSRVVVEHAEYHFYGALARAACCSEVPTEMVALHLAALAAHHHQLEKWAAVCSENFADRSALIAAELARLESREIDAERLYERAIRLAHDQGFVQNEGLALELASRFYPARGFEVIAEAYLRAARRCYFRWGALGKVKQIDQLHPRLHEEMPRDALTSTITAPADQLDLATVLSVSQAISGEMVLEKLIDLLMRTALEHAGAERGLMLFCGALEHRIVAEATIRGDTFVVRRQDDIADQAMLPESVVQYVAHTHEYVILDDALAHNQFSSDAYIAEHRARSILCLPLLNQGKLIAVLYLENNLSPHVFTSARLDVLKLLASQAAISLENAHLYRNLEEREKEARESQRRNSEMQMELAHANRVATVGQLSASITHEVSQPIAGAATNVGAALRWLGHQPPNVERALRALNGAADSTERAREILAGIRALVSKAPKQKEPFEINEAIHEVIMLAQAEIRKNGISVVTELGEGLPRLTGNRIQLQQVMLNLINNAVQAMSAAGVEPRELFIFTSKTDRDGIVVAVRDSGPGLDPESPERVFDAFYTTKPDGLGMGLSICRSIIEAHGGRLWASANTPRGAAFQFTVPA
jgi:C4-dicarboxylate-specific signal transduction histidine kinase